MISWTGDWLLICGDTAEAGASCIVRFATELAEGKKDCCTALGSGSNVT